MRFKCPLNECEASMIMEGSWFQAIIVRGKKENL